LKVISKSAWRLPNYFPIELEEKVCAASLLKDNQNKWLLFN